MTRLNRQTPVQKLVDVVSSLPTSKVMAHKELDAQGHWSVLFVVAEDADGWTSLKTVSQAIIPTNGTIPRVDFRLLFVSEANEAVFALSPDHRGVGPEEVAANIEAHQALRFREFGQGVLN